MKFHKSSKLRTWANKNHPEAFEFIQNKLPPKNESQKKGIKKIMPKLLTFTSEIMDEFSKLSTDEKVSITTSPDNPVRNFGGTTVHTIAKRGLPLLVNKIRQGSSELSFFTKLNKKLAKGNMSKINAEMQGQKIYSLRGMRTIEKIEINDGKVVIYSDGKGIKEQRVIEDVDQEIKKIAKKYNYNQKLLVDFMVHAWNLENRGTGFHSGLNRLVNPKYKS